MIAEEHRNNYNTLLVVCVITLILLLLIMSARALDMMPQADINLTDHDLKDVYCVRFNDSSDQCTAGLTSTDAQDNNITDLWSNASNQDERIDVLELLETHWENSSVDYITPKNNMGINASNITSTNGAVNIHTDLNVTDGTLEVHTGNDNYTIQYTCNLQGAAGTGGVCRKVYDSPQGSQYYNSDKTNAFTKLVSRGDGITGMVLFSDDGEQITFLKYNATAYGGMFFMVNNGGDVVIDGNGTTEPGKVRPYANNQDDLGAADKCWQDFYYYTLNDCGSPTETLRGKQATPLIRQLAEAHLAATTETYYLMIPAEFEGEPGGCGHNTIRTDEVINALVLSVTELDEINNGGKIRELESRVLQLEQDITLIYSILRSAGFLTVVAGAGVVARRKLNET